MATWTPQIRQQVVPTDVREIARLNATLPDGTLKVPRGGVVLDDGTILDEVVAIGRRGDTLISNGGGDESYHITWLQSDGHYLISIQKEPYAEVRERAEAEYLKRIANGSIDEACVRRNVSIETAAWLNPRPVSIPKYCL